MPTGYTYGIEQGKISTFQEFAKECMRAFVIHMRDDDNNKEYYPQTLSGYYSKELSNSRRSLTNIMKLSDKDVISKRKCELIKDKKYASNRIVEKKKLLVKLNEMLSKAKEYQSPTEEHNGIRDFMIQQLETTIDHDCDTKYSERELVEINAELKNINPIVVRENCIKSEKENIERYLKGHNEEVDRCNANNKWASDFLKSIS